MKSRIFNIVTAVTFAGVFAALLWWSNMRDHDKAETAAGPQAGVRKERHRPLLPAQRGTAASAPEPQPVKKPAADNPVKASVKPQPATSQEQREAAVRRYWEQQSLRFNRQKEQLDREQNPARRKSLIRSISRFIRTDTPAVLDWAMNMTDPEEQRMALEAINEYALSGIGARIEMDETGLPKIRETTLLSAVGSTGQVEAGDYIVGMHDAGGNAIYFEGLTTAQVVRHLRGKPGTDITLLMKREHAGGSAQEFNVDVQRSLLVVQPPL